MSLSDAFKKAAQSTLAAFGDVIKPMTLTPNVPGTYDPQGGTVTKSGAAVQTMGALIERRVKRSAGGVSGAVSELTAYIAQADLLDVVPHENDRLTVEGKTYRIKHETTDPAKALYVLTLGQP